MTEGPQPLTDEWRKSAMFEHLALIACEPDKWERVRLLTAFGHQVNATVEAALGARRTADEDRFNDPNYPWRCTRCGEYLQGVQVTYQERHDGECGGRCVVDLEPLRTTSAEGQS